jgi:hypothetical protein
MFGPRRLRLAGSVAAILGVALGILSAPSSASTARVVDVVLPPDCRFPPPGGTCPPGSATALVYRAAGGEANRVELARAAGEVAIADPGADIQPGDGCRLVDGDDVRCTLPAMVFVDTGGGADRIRSAIGGAVINGGAGRDVLIGSPLADQLYGGRGTDVLRGRGGDDRLYDASPRASLGSGDLAPFFQPPLDQTSFAPAAVPLTDLARRRDRFDGGRGYDTVSYEGRAAGITVDLADASAAGAEDSVREVEFALGGTGDDRLLGNARSNRLDGREGDDRIAGRAGSDSLEGGGGRNLMFGGAGGDQVSLRLPDRSPERVACGSGKDTVFEISPDDFLQDDCEALEFTTFGGRLIGTVRSLLPLRSGDPPEVLAAPLFCAPFATPADCRIELELRVHGPATPRGTAPPRGTLLGSSSYTVALEETRVVRLALSRRGRELLRRHRALHVRVTTTGTSPDVLGGYLTVVRAP